MNQSNSTYLNVNQNSYCKDGNKFYNLLLFPPSNLFVLDSEQLALSMELGDEKKLAKVVLILYSLGYNSKAIKAKLNGIALKYKSTTHYRLSIFEIPQDAVKSGENQLLLNCSS